MTQRLRERLQQHDRTPEVHLYEGEPHRLGADAENRHYELLIEFFTRHLM